MFRMGTNRRVGMLAVVVVLSLGSPLAAAGWETPARWADSGDFLKSFTLVLDWLGVRPVAGGTSKCDAGMVALSGCAKGGARIGPNGVHRSVTDWGTTIDPNGQH